MYSPIPELNQLKDFYDRVGHVGFSDGFEFYDYGSNAGLDTWSPDPEFVSRFIPFAQSTGSGSSYALWRCDDRTDLATLPVIMVGDEGELYVVARNLLELFQVLTIDSEFHDPDLVEDHSFAHEDYLTWLDQNFGLGPPEDLEAFWAEMKEVRDQFRTWRSQYVDLDD